MNTMMAQKTSRKKPSASNLHRVVLFEVYSTKFYTHLPRLAAHLRLMFSVNSPHLRLIFIVYVL